MEDDIYIYKHSQHHFLRALQTSLVNIEKLIGNKIGWLHLKKKVIPATFYTGHAYLPSRHTREDKYPPVSPEFHATP